MTLNILGITSAEDASDFALRRSWSEARRALATFKDTGGNAHAAARCLEAYMRFAFFMGCSKPATAKLMHTMARDLLDAIDRQVAAPLRRVPDPGAEAGAGSGQWG